MSIHIQIASASMKTPAHEFQGQNHLNFSSLLFNILIKGKLLKYSLFPWS